MRGPIFDPTGGERARAIRFRPEAPQPILDPMDRRCGRLAGEFGAAADTPRWVVDPTDPACEEVTA